MLLRQCLRPARIPLPSLTDGMPKSQRQMKIVIDSHIPYIRDAIARITPDAVYIDGKDITNADVRDADALIVRTRTACDERLLHGSTVRFIATATIGYDHLDTAYLERAGIKWINCPGCNSGSVAQYIRSALLLLLRAHYIYKGGTLGIVGVGHIGAKVRALAAELGLRVVACDPPRHDNDGDDSCGASMDEIAATCDVITFHVPLTRTGKYPTFHIAGNQFLSSLKRKPVIINTSRGAVVDNLALLDALNKGTVSQTVIDTWENEPHINLQLLERAFIATPHIAGYSADGKANADNMVLDALCRFFRLSHTPHVSPPDIILNEPLPERGTADFYLRMYNPMDDSRKLKTDPQAFESLRSNYPLRREP